ncbi:ATP-dependent DNA ligase [Myxococcota bacterium]|nr:ATP-dependent DNA ligase [Myxococcota bacterium]
MLLGELAATSERLASTSRRNEKISILTALVARIPDGERDAAIRWLSGAVRQRKLGVGWAMLRETSALARATESTLTVPEVDAALSEIADTSGRGANERRIAKLSAVFRRATEAEGRFLAKLIVGELRQGALESLVVEALARAANVQVASVRRALMVSADLGAVARAALSDGEAGLGRFGLRVFSPVQPMLAQPAEDLDDVFARFPRAIFDVKLDGARVQVHKAGGDVRVFTRRLNDVTARVPELVASVASLPARELILDGEVLALAEGGRPHPFQVTMRRFGRTQGVEALQSELPLSTFFFDVLHADGETLLARSAEERMKILEDTIPAEQRVPRLVTSDPVEAAALFERTLASGHEGLMAKALDAPYEAGNRGAGWLKLKAAHTLDLVVLAAEWGSGRREGWLSNLHLAARDERTGQLVMLGKTFKGMTDDMLDWQTKRLLELETHREGYVVFVRPELVAEIAFGDVQTSPQYPAGLALRFARVKRYRPDKTPAEADTLTTVQAIHRTTTEKEEP